MELNPKCWSIFIVLTKVVSNILGVNWSNLLSMLYGALSTKCHEIPLFPRWINITIMYVTFLHVLFLLEIYPEKCSIRWPVLWDHIWHMWPIFMTSLPISVNKFFPTQAECYQLNCHRIDMFRPKPSISTWLQWVYMHINYVWILSLSVYISCHLECDTNMTIKH